MIRGLIVGKFYPPHSGHQYLIETALAQVEQLFVIVCQRPDEQPCGELRAAWLRELYPDARVLLVDDCYDADDSQLWAKLCREWLGFAPEVVFTSEDYGERFAHYLDCRHVLVDHARSKLPISGTRVRANAMNCWQYLTPPVRGYYAKRVCLVGAESTGKTTLAQDLATYFATCWVPEYGREYSERMLAEQGEYRWQSADFVHIAMTQCQREDAAARHCQRVLLCDTDAFATTIWHRRYLQERSPEVEAIAARHRVPDLYLLCDVDVPFVQDGTRDGEQIRTWMHAVFLDELQQQQRPYLLLQGDFAARRGQAILAIEQLLSQEDVTQAGCSATQSP